MRSDELIAAVRLRAQLKDTHPDWTNDAILSEMNGVLQSTFTPVLLAARTGLLLKRFTQFTRASLDVYRLPPRAVAGALEDLVCIYEERSWPLRPIEPEEAYQYEHMTAGDPQVYVMLGSSVRLYPTPTAGIALRMQYYLRPSRLVAPQSAGLITAIAYDPVSSSYNAASTTRVLTVTTGLVDRATGAAVPSSSTNAFYDVIRAGALATGTNYGQWGANTYEVVMAHGRPIGVSTDVAFTFPLDTAASFAALSSFDRYPQSDMSEVLLGDWLRIAGQSEWPTIPHEFHSSLATATAALICGYRGMTALAQSLGGVVAGDLERMRHVIQPRVKSHAPKLVPRAHMLRGRG